VSNHVVLRTKHVAKSRPRLRSLNGRLAKAFSLSILHALFVNTAFAASDEALRQFSLGKDAFERGDFSLALSSFETASQQGMSGPALHFNIGVTAYLLEKCERARTAFLEVANTASMASLAHYNLGLTALKCDARDARRWFEAVIEANDEKLVPLAEQQLAMLSTPSPANWIAFASVEVGYDDNVALVANADLLGVSGVADNYLEGQFIASAPLTGPWQFDAAVDWLKYQEFDEFDQLNMLGSAHYQLDTGPWTNRATLQLAYYTLAGDGFESEQMLQMETGRAVFKDGYLRFQYRFSAIEGLHQYQGISGQRHEAGVHLDTQWNEWELGVGYIYSRSKHDDESLSANRNEIGLTVERQLFTHWTLGIAAAYRDGVYVLTDDREDRLELGMAISYSLSDDCRLLGRYAYTNSDAETEELSFERNRIGMALQVTF
jgi:hypothetical protein